MNTPALPGWAAYKVIPFDDSKDLESVAAEWEALAGPDEFEIELGGLFEWCGDHLLPVEGDGHAMRVLNELSGQTDAILEMVSGKRGALSKLLRLHVSPKFWPADRDLEVRDRFQDLYTGIFVQVISAGIVERGVNEVRIYGRTELMYVMLKNLSENWRSIEDITWSASMEGRWLSFREGND